ncbi:MAG TPA: helix-turn-helix transcriptional regulator, partial [Polyangiaceae bacterium]
DGSIRLLEMQREGTTCKVTLRRKPQPVGGLLSLRERSVVRRLALGQCQKLVAYEFGLAHTTVSSHLRGALDKLGLARWEHAVLLAAVFEAHETRGLRVRVEQDVRPGATEGQGQTDTTIIVECELAHGSLLLLTEAERDVALLVVDGCANSEVGRRRRCSARTVANQISSAFRKLRVHGRCELIRLLVLSRGPSDVVGAPADTAPQSDRRAVATAPDDVPRREIAQPALAAQTG